jgi:hypothetical protein
VVAVYGDYVLINETKSSLDAKDVDEFVKMLSGARGFFPEYASRHFIGAIASLYMGESVVRYGEKQGVLEPIRKPKFRVNSALAEVPDGNTT